MARREVARQDRYQAALFVDELIKLDLDALAGGAAVASAGGKQRARFLGAGGLDAPLFDARDHHPGVKQPRLGFSRRSFFRGSFFGRPFFGLSRRGSQRATGRHDLGLANQ
jgi:hypothetical protein